MIYQGRDGRGPGPDFRNALISGPSRLPLRGDVELHVRSSSFRAHGHHRDPAYGNVILHVVFEDDTGADTPLPGGRVAPVIALAPWVAARAGELERWLAQPLLWREPCHDAVMRMGAEGAGAAVDAEGDRRFDEKAARISERIGQAGIEQALYEGILEALGYGGNAGAMLALARLLPWRLLSGALAGCRQTSRRDTTQLGERAADDRHTVEAEAALLGSRTAERDNAEPGGRAGRRLLHAEAAMLGSAGLLPSQRGHRGPLNPYVEALEREFAARRSTASLSPSLWKLWGVRPENAPARRIAGAAALLASLGAPSSALRIVDATSVRELTRHLTVSATAYWRSHHDPCAGPCALSDGFIGRSRALEIAVNVVLPAAAASGEAELAGRARTMYARLPRPASYGRTRFIENALASGGTRVPVNARRAQGLLQLNRDWCTQDGCGRCALSPKEPGVTTGWAAEFDPDYQLTSRESRQPEKRGGGGPAINRRR